MGGGDAGSGTAGEAEEARRQREVEALLAAFEEGEINVAVRPLVVPDDASERCSRDAYAHLSVTIAEERTAAEAERGRLQANAEALLAARQELDTEHETLTRLAELRRAIAGRVTDASPVGDIGALRAALSAVCAEVRLHSVASGTIVLDYHPVLNDDGDPWQRVGLSFDTANNMSGSGVPE